MDDSGFLRRPDRSVKLLGTCVRYLRSVETSIGARGPDFLGGSATSTTLSSLPSNFYGIWISGIAYTKMTSLDLNMSMKILCIMKSVKQKI